MLDYFLKCPPFILTLVRATLCEFISQENDFKIAWRISQGIWPAVLLAQLRKPPRALLFRPFCFVFAAFVCFFVVVVFNNAFIEFP
uniref:Uncharacterized protein n=1 Tax=Anguilla anguilla TaxID=7936 RepID=A0A0E9PKG2_ANGAN